MVSVLADPTAFGYIECVWYALEPLPSNPQHSFCDRFGLSMTELDTLLAHADPPFFPGALKELKSLRESSFKASIVAACGFSAPPVFKQTARSTAALERAAGAVGGVSCANR